MIIFVMYWEGSHTFSMNWVFDNIKNWLKVLCNLTSTVLVSYTKESTWASNCLVLVINLAEKSCK